jgi:hypothetical protein
LSVFVPYSTPPHPPHPQNHVLSPLVCLHVVKHFLD